MDITGELKVGKRFALLFGAFFIAIVAVLLRVEYLYYMSFALAVTPLVSWFFGRRGVQAVSARRSLPGVVKAGERLDMGIGITNEGSTRKQFLLARDTLPPGLVPEGSTERYIADLLPGETVSVDYPFIARRRGVYAFGWVDLVCTDPLGLFTYSREAPAEATLIVHPRPVPLPRTKPPSAGRQFSNRTRARHRGEGTDFRGVREYTPGDDLRRIDWKVTAKRNKLTVVEFESGEANSLGVVLDLAPEFHQGDGDDSTLEVGVTLAASIASQALKRGAEFSLVAEGKNSHSHRSLISNDEEAAAMDSLARVRANSPVSLAETLASADMWLPQGAGVVVISPAVGEAAVAAARRLTLLEHGVLWVSLVAPTFAQAAGQKPVADASDYEELAAGLAAARCAVRQIRLGDDLATQMGVRVHAG